LDEVKLNLKISKKLIDNYCKLGYNNNVKYILHFLIRKGKNMLKNKILELRIERKISQEELALALKVSRQTISSLENNRYKPSIILAFKIARYFNMKIEDIFIYG